MTSSPGSRRVLVVEGRWRYHVAGCPTLPTDGLEEGDVLDIRDEGFTACPTCSPDQELAALARAEAARTATANVPSPAPQPPAPESPQPRPAGSGATGRALAGTALLQLGQVHRRQLGWRVWLRGAWWLVLLPLALVCWAAQQTSRPRQVVGWALAGVALLLYIGGALGDPETDGTTAASTFIAPSSSASPSASTRAMAPRPTQAVPTPPPATASRRPVAVTPRPSTTAPSMRPLVTAPRATRTATTRPTTAAPVPLAAESFSNCTELNGTYPHGVGMPGATDQVRGSTTPVTTFKQSAALYQANSGSDRDKDQIACEQP